MTNWESLIAERTRHCASMPRYADARQENTRNAQRNYKRKHREMQNKYQRKWAEKNRDYWRNYNKLHPEKKALWNKTYSEKLKKRKQHEQENIRTR